MPEDFPEAGTTVAVGQSGGTRPARQARPHQRPVVERDGEEAQPDLHSVPHPEDLLWDSTSRFEVVKIDTARAAREGDVEIPQAVVR